MELTLAYLELLFIIGRKTLGQQYSEKGFDNIEGVFLCNSKQQVNKNVKTKNSPLKQHF